MAALGKDSYFIVRDNDGIDYLCPLNTVKDRDDVTDSEMDNCVEKDVVERYSGNIDREPEQ